MANNEIIDKPQYIYTIMKSLGLIEESQLAYTAFNKII